MLEAYKICHMCQSSDLILSHIVPRWSHTNGKKLDRNLIQIIDGKKYDVSLKEEGSIKERLLCSKCDEKLGKWENYLKGIFVPTSSFNYTKTGITAHHINETFIFHNVDERFILALAGLIYKASLSDLPMYRKHKLASSTLLKLRNNLNNSTIPQNLRVIYIYKYLNVEQYIPNAFPQTNQSINKVRANKTKNSLWQIMLGGWLIVLEEKDSKLSFPDSICWDQNTFTLEYKFASYFPKKITEQKNCKDEIQDLLRIYTVHPCDVDYINELSPSDLKSISDEIICPCGSYMKLPFKFCCKLFY